MNHKTAVYIGLGSNMSNPIEQLDLAVRKIVNCDHFAMILTSSYYKSSPVGYSDQDDFINCVLRADTSFSPHELLEFLQGIEDDANRQRDPGNPNGPRPIDCDILLFGSEEVDTETLQVPHPRMTQRLFVLLPLAELNKRQVIPGKGEVQELLEELKNSPAAKLQSLEKI